MASKRTLFFEELPPLKRPHVAGGFEVLPDGVLGTIVGFLLPIAHKDDQYAQYHRMAARMYDALAYNHEAMPLARRARAAGLLPAPPLRPPLGECRRLPAHAARDLRAALPGQAGPGLPLPAVRAPVPGDYGGADAPGAGAAPRSRASIYVAVLRLPSCRK